MPRRCSLTVALFLSCFVAFVSAQERASIFKDDHPKPPDNLGAQVPNQKVVRQRDVPDADAISEAGKLLDKAVPPPIAGDATVQREYFDLIEKRLPSFLAEPAALYAALDRQRALAQRAGWVREALTACDRLAANFKVDALAFHGAAVAALAETRGGNTNEDTQIFQAAIDLIERNTTLTSNANPQALEALIKIVEKITSRYSDTRLTAKLAIAKARYAAWLTVRSHRDHPDSPEARVSAGRLLCFYDEDWQQGLPYLAAVPDARLKAAVARDLATPADPLQAVRVADAWWELAKASKHAVEGPAMLRRAGDWYQRGLASLSGPPRLQAFKRIEEASQTLPAEIRGRAPPSGSVVLVLDGTGTMVGLKWELVKKQTMQFLRESGSDVMFGVVVFFDGEKSGMLALGSKLLPNTPENQERVAAMLDGFKARGSTNPIPGLGAAFRLKPQRVVFLTDGEFDNLVSYEQVQASIYDFNRVGIRLDTIMFGDRDPKAQKVLQDLAAFHHGQFRAVTTDELTKKR
jgi:hypothetical protein